MVNYHSLIPKWYSFSDIKKMNNSFNNRLDKWGFDGVYEGKLQGSRLVTVKVLTKLETDGEEFINEVASISRTSHINVGILPIMWLPLSKKMAVIFKREGQLVRVK
jgi:interleukin-1 receptor-associated kinase 1